MRSRLRLFSGGGRRGHAPVALAPLLLAALAAAACGSREEGAGAHGVVIVNSPASGEVRRVLVKEGERLRKGDAVAEIVVGSEVAAAPTPRGEDPVSAAGRNITSARDEIEAARAEVVRAEVEVQRLAPLVASGRNSQGELDGARSTYERAQQRLQRAQSAAQAAQSGLVAARQPERIAAPTPTPLERLVYATATSDGTVSAISVSAGSRVTTGQPLATLRAGL
ncbi:MAG: hypothetical protein ABW208_17600 [Pyrinomonadaceae bacterium]